MSTFVTILKVGECVEAYADPADARTAERAYLLQGVKQRQMQVSTLQVNPSTADARRAEQRAALVARGDID